MKRRTIIASAIAGLLTFGAVAAQAGPGGKHRNMSDEDRAAHMEKRLNRMATKLELTDEQKTQIQALKTNSINEMKPLRDEMKALREEMKALDPKASDYATKLADAANRKAELSRQMTVAKGTQRQQMAAILTTEQLVKMQELRGSRKGKRGGKRRGHKGKRDQQES